MLVPGILSKLGNLVARESTRYAINGILLKRDADGKCVAAVTNGRFLCVSKWDDEPIRGEFPVIHGCDSSPKTDFEVVVDLRQWKSAHKLLPKRTINQTYNRFLVDEHSANGKLTISATDGTATSNCVDDSLELDFPHYEDIVPKYEVGVEAVEIGVDPKRLAELLLTMSEVGADVESKGVRLVIPVDPSRPMAIHGRSISEQIESTGVLMPVNLNVPTQSHGTQQVAALLRIVEALYSADQHKQGSEERQVAINRAIGDAGELLRGTMGYVTISKSEFPILKKMEWSYPPGLGKECLVSPACYASIRKSYDAAIPEVDVDAIREKVDGKKPSPPEPAVLGDSSPGDSTPTPGSLDAAIERNAGKKLKSPENKGPWVVDSKTGKASRLPKVKKKKTSTPRAAPAPASTRVSISRLRSAPNKWAPVSGSRCRLCGANVNRSQFAPSSKWLVVNGEAFCPECEDAHES